MLAHRALQSHLMWVVHLAIFCGVRSFASLLVFSLCLSFRSLFGPMLVGSRLGLASHCRLCRCVSIRWLGMRCGPQHGTGALHRRAKGISVYAMSGVGDLRKGMDTLTLLGAGGHRHTLKMQRREVRRAVVDALFCFLFCVGGGA